jgi:hypothetical protein
MNIGTVPRIIGVRFDANQNRPLLQSTDTVG